MKRIFLITMILTPLFIKAQDTISMGLKECMRYAVEHSTKVVAQNADNRDAQVNRRDAILSTFTPEISGNAYAYYNFGRSIDPESNTYSTVTSFHNGYSVSAGIDLFNGFQAVNNMKITKTAQLMGKTKSQQLEDQICLATMEAFCNVLYFTKLEEALTAQVETAEKALQLAERQEKLGRKSHADVVQMQADLAERQYQLTNCHNRYNDAVITLKDVMFWPIEQPLKVVDDITNSEISFDKSGEDAQQMAENAKEIMPAVMLAESTMNNAELELRTSRWKLLPRLSLYGGWSTNYFTYPGLSGYTPVPFEDQFRNNRGEYIQLSLSIPIYDRLSRHSTISRRKNAYIKAKADYDQAVQQVEAEVYRAVADCEGTADAMRQAETRAELQEEAFALNAKRFEQGLISSIEYQTASNTYLNALAEKMNAKMQHFIKKSVVKYYKGIHYLEQ
ncbi:MAG: TolC family protein [Bacteroidales bacterium]|nr:TolC family protein [Bacteroidales bacterium]